MAFMESWAPAVNAGKIHHLATEGGFLPVFIFNVVIDVFCKQNAI